MLRFLTAGESHGKALVAILDGMVADLPLSVSDINPDLALRQEGHGRGDRMKLEKDKVEILSGVREDKTIGSPIALLIPNKSTEFFGKALTVPRPGHADLAGALKYEKQDIRNVIERASARETAARVAVGAVAKKLLKEIKISVKSSIVHIGGKNKKGDWEKAIDQAKAAGDTLGGVFEVIIEGCPPGLGSYAQWDLRLDTALAAALMSIPAIKGVEIGLGFMQTILPGSQVHDEILYEKGKFTRKTNHAGGLEGGVTNGEPVVLRAAMKPICTLMKPLNSVDLRTKTAAGASVERSDVCAVEAAAAVGSAMASYEVARAVLEKFGGDTLADLKTNISSYQKHLSVI